MIDTALLGLIAPLLPEIEQRTGAGDTTLGLALAAYAVPIAVLSLPLGRAADAVGRRALLVAGLLIVAIGSGLVADSHSTGVLRAATGAAGRPLPTTPTPRGRPGNRARTASMAT